MIRSFAGQLIIAGCYGAFEANVREGDPLWIFSTIILLVGLWGLQLTISGIAEETVKKFSTPSAEPVAKPTSGEAAG